MLMAARDVLGHLQIQTSELFVSGCSQGGWATMVFLQKLEEVGVKVTATATPTATATATAPSSSRQSLTKKSGSTV